MGAGGEVGAELKTYLGAVGSGEGQALRGRGAELILIVNCVKRPKPRLWMVCSGGLRVGKMGLPLNSMREEGTPACRWNPA